MTRRSAPRLVRRDLPASHDLPDTIHPILRRVFAARGALSPQDLEFTLAGLHDTQSLGGMPQAIELLITALEKDARIVVVADFDADGATSCAVALRALRAMGARNVGYLVPNRFAYGYGLTPPIVELAREMAPDLLITVDNGISSLDGVAAAKQAGMQVLVTDHHLAGPALPAADAIVNPNVAGDAFPSKALAGVGVIFYVMLALRAELRKRGWFAARGIAEPNLAELLDLVALGTVADVVPLDANNRRLVAQGLSRIRAGRCQPGIAALIQISGRDARKLLATDLAFALGPRLNAAGRLDDMSHGIELLLSDEPAFCRAQAAELDTLNAERRNIEREMKEQALAILDALPLAAAEALPAGICLYEPSWHQGVIGVVAGRVKDAYHRPVIAFAPGADGEIKGSARSIPDVHVRDALEAVAARHPALLQRFGGHAMAAGLTLREADFEPFSAAFAAEVARQVDVATLDHVLLTDGELGGRDFTLELARELAFAAPWGQGFPEPLFEGEFLVRGRRVVGGSHLKLTLEPAGTGLAIAGIAFNALEAPWAEAARIRGAYRLQVNEYQGMESLQLLVEHAEAL